MIAPRSRLMLVFRAGLAYQQAGPDRRIRSKHRRPGHRHFHGFHHALSRGCSRARRPENITSLKTEQARGNFTIGKYYESHGKWLSAKIYYNEVVNLLIGEPNSTYAKQARERIEALNKRIQPEQSKK